MVTENATTQPAPDSSAADGPAAAGPSPVTSPATTPPGTVERLRVEVVDPATLLVDVNIRLDGRADSRADADFLASVRDLGVLVPVVAVRTAEGGLRVRFGHRRTAAATRAGLSGIPVVIAGEDGTDDAAQVQRLLGQWAENEHRAGLSTAERVGVVAQLAAFGVSRAQIAKRTRLPRRDVDAALTVAGDDLARAATARYDFLDLVQAATVADYSGDPDAVKALVAAAKTGQFAHVAQRLADQRAETQARRGVEQPLREAGVRVIDCPDHTSPTRRVTTLTGDAPDAQDPTPFTPDSHAGCPGHAAYLTETWVRTEPATPDTPAATEDEQDDEQDDEQSDDERDDDEQDDERDDDERDDEDAVMGGWQWVPVYVCTDPAGNGHRPLYGGSTSASGTPGRVKADDMTPQEREAARAERRDVIDSNKAWASAETVRRQWLRTFLTRKTAPKGTATFLAVALACDAHLLAEANGNRLAADLLGLPQTAGYGRHPGLTETAATAGEARALVIALGQVLAAYEARTDRTCWRHPRPDTTRYLTFLADHGYTLSPVEDRARTTT